MVDQSQDTKEALYEELKGELIEDVRRELQVHRDGELERYNQLWDAHVDHLKEEKKLQERIEELELQVMPKLMTAKEVADAVGVAEGVFYEFKRRGDAPPAIYFSARTVRYDRADVVKWWSAKKVGAGA